MSVLCTFHHQDAGYFYLGLCNQDITTDDSSDRSYTSNVTSMASSATMPAEHDIKKEIFCRACNIYPDKFGQFAHLSFKDDNKDQTGLVLADLVYIYRKPVAKDKFKELTNVNMYGDIVYFAPGINGIHWLALAVWFGTKPNMLSLNSDAKRDAIIGMYGKLGSVKAVTSEQKNSPIDIMEQDPILNPVSEEKVRPCDPFLAHIPLSDAMARVEKWKANYDFADGDTIGFQETYNGGTGRKSSGDAKVLAYEAKELKEIGKSDYAPSQSMLNDLNKFEKKTWIVRKDKRSLLDEFNNHTESKGKGPIVPNRDVKKPAVIGLNSPAQAEEVSKNVRVTNPTEASNGYNWKQQLEPAGTWFDKVEKNALKSDSYRKSFCNLKPLPIEVPKIDDTLNDQFHEDPRKPNSVAVNKINHQDWLGHRDDSLNEDGNVRVSCNNRFGMKTEPTTQKKDAHDMRSSKTPLANVPLTQECLKTSGVPHPGHKVDPREEFKNKIKKAASSDISSSKQTEPGTSEITQRMLDEVVEEVIVKLEEMGLPTNSAFAVRHVVHETVYEQIKFIRLDTQRFNKTRDGIVERILAM